LVVALHQVEGDVAAARRRRVLHSGGLSRCGALCIFQFAIDAGSRLKVLGDYMSVDVLVGAASSGFCCGCRVEYSPIGQSCLWRRVVRLVSMPQSDWLELLSSV
jgi:hypothetical protein